VKEQRKEGNSKKEKGMRKEEHEGGKVKRKIKG
jgi:hypothetical protein